MNEPQSSRAAARRWLVCAGSVAVAGVALYFLYRPAWDAFHWMLNPMVAVSLLMWQRQSGFARGWDAAERHHVDSGRR